MKINKFMRIIMCALLFSLLLTGCSKKEELKVTDTTITVNTKIVQMGTMEIDGTYIGIISADETVSIIPQVSGIVENVNVKVGDKVSAHELLCRFEDAGARYSLESAQADYNSAQVGLSSAAAGYDSATANYNKAEDASKDMSSLQNKQLLAEENYKKMLVLFDRGAVSQAEVDSAYDSLLTAKAAIKSAEAGIAEAEAGLSAAKAALKSAQVGVEAAKYQLSLYSVTAPFSGVVDAVNVTANNMFAAGNIAFVISSPEAKTVTFYVAREVKDKLQEGQAVSVSSSGRTYYGSISEIGIAIDVSTGLFKVKAMLDDAIDLPNGTAVELNTVTHVIEKSVLIPYDALYFDSGNAYVYVAHDGKAVKTFVTVALFDADMAAISDGLAPGQEIIISWDSALKDGAPIRNTNTPK